MSRRTGLFPAMVLLAAVGFLAGCQGTNSTPLSAFKLPTPSFNLLAPYGPPRVPPPGTYSYGQPGSVASASVGAQPYYPGSTTTIRGISAPTLEQGDSQTAPALPQGKVASAVWKSVDPVATEDASSSDATQLVSYETSAAEIPSGDGEIRIPQTVVQPAQAVPLVLGGMPAHDLTGAVQRDSAPLLAAASIPGQVIATTSLPAPMATQVIYAAPASQPVVVASAAPAGAAAAVTVRSTSAAGATDNGLIEISELPQAPAAANRSLQRVRGFETPSAGAPATQAAPDNFISPEMTISAVAARQTRDAVAAAAVESDPPIIKPAPAATPGGWKSRYSTDES